MTNVLHLRGPIGTLAARLEAGYVVSLNEAFEVCSPVDVDALVEYGHALPLYQDGIVWLIGAEQYQELRLSEML